MSFAPLLSRPRPLPRLFPPVYIADQPHLLADAMDPQLVTMMPMLTLRVGLMKDKVDGTIQNIVTVRHGCVIFPPSHLLTLAHTFSHFGKVTQV